jgi:hypothetical protein
LFYANSLTTMTNGSSPYMQQVCGDPSQSHLQSSTPMNHAPSPNHVQNYSQVMPSTPTSTTAIPPFPFANATQPQVFFESFSMTGHQVHNTTAGANPFCL